MRPIVVALAIVLGSCATSRRGGEAARPAPRLAPAPSAAPAGSPGAGGSAGAATLAPGAPRAIPAPGEGATREDVARARALVDQGVRLYREGEYTKAEDVLKQAITIYPFMADANLVLAKILLIRASATRDMTLYTNARLMLEMARALEPGSHEIQQLLELVRQPTAE